jgi:hypothetical protein
VREPGEPKPERKAAPKGAVSVGLGSPKKTVIYFSWAMKLAVLCIQHYPAERCFNHPSEVVDEFLQILAKYKK